MASDHRAGTRGRPGHRPRDLTGVILAGGKSARYGGQSKALLTLGGEAMLCRRVRLVGAELPAPVVVAGRESLLPAGPYTLVYDHVVSGPAGSTLGQAGGPLAALAVGLSACPSEWAFVSACDMPFFSGALVDLLWASREGADVVIPRVGTLLEPLHALYRLSCRAAVERALARGERRLVTFHREVSVRYVEEAAIREVDPRLLSFRNVNTPADLADAQRELASQNRASPASVQPRLLFGENGRDGADLGRLA
jgi:molybdopterin-guanine dinucleotide biosynthesis protein A